MIKITRGTLLAVLVASTLSGCGAAMTRSPVPDDLTDEVHPFGIPGLREWGDALTEEDIVSEVRRVGPGMKARFGRQIAAGRIPKLEFLALSGGGQWGAFGAGILQAWSENGTRPEFHGVSGVSTGAIIAPFAFLGPEYDATLREIYSDYNTEMLVESTVVSGLLSGTALADTTKLAKVIAKYFTQDLLDKIAVEHRRGRILHIGTTNLDAGRPVIWDIGAIADSGHPGALQLVRDLIRASAAIPVAFPPIFVDVQTADGRVFDEMHVDGGASSQVTFVSPGLPIAKATRRILGRNLERRLWVIVNNDLAPPHSTVRPRLPAIAGAALSSLLRGSGVGDVYRLYAIAERDDIDFKVTWIPPKLPCAPPKEDFDTTFMPCLYNYAGDYLRTGKAWKNLPPFFATDLPAALTSGKRS